MDLRASDVRGVRRRAEFSGRPGRSREATALEREDEGLMMWTEIQQVASSGKCFVPSTMLWTSRSDARIVESIRVGDTVIGVFQTQLRVTFAKTHSPAVRDLVELRTRAAYLKVTADHSITVPDRAGRPSHSKQAKDLKSGDRVFVGQRIAELVCVRSSRMRIEAVELHFDPDEPVESFLSPRWGLLSRGHASKEDMDSIPDTDDGF